MVVKQNFCEVDTWTVADLVDACEPEPTGKRRINIPEFQRRLVWTKEKQEKLISSVKQGFPIGSLLLYEGISFGSTNENAKRTYKLIDGLQRTQALRRYVYEPTKFFSREDITPDVVEGIRLALTVYGISEEKLIFSVVKWVRDLRGFTETDGWGVDGLLRALISELPFDQLSAEFMRAYFEISQNGLLKQQLAQFLRDVREDADISKARLPIIIYNGPASELPAVFELLNSQGTALSRYEIFAAQWIDQRQTIQNEAIIKAIWRKYEALEEEGFTLDVAEEAPDHRSRKLREYTLFEYLFGLGQLLSEKYPQLFKRVSADRPSSAGFNLAAACSNLNVKEMEKLPDKLKQVDRADLEEAILESVEFVQCALKPILSVKQQSGRPSIYHSEYQIISMIATAFHVRYDYRNRLQDVEGWRNQRKILERNLLMFFLYDLLRDYWRGSGDTKLYEIVSRLRYVGDPPTWQNWEQVLDTWFLDNQATLQHNRRYVRDATPEILLLKYIYAHILTVAENALSYHIEHVIPIDQLTSIMSENDRWPVNAVSNLALLRETDNKRKGNKTFKEYWDAALVSGRVDSDEHQQWLEEMSGQLICPIDILPQPLTKEGFETYLLQRFDKLKQAFFDAWHEYIPYEQA